MIEAFVAALRKMHTSRLMMMLVSPETMLSVLAVSGVPLGDLNKPGFWRPYLDAVTAEIDRRIPVPVS